MTKLLAIVIIVLMVLHVIRPLGWPGLKTRRDVWKLAVATIAALAFVVGLRDFTG